MKTASGSALLNDDLKSPKPPKFVGVRRNRGLTLAELVIAIGLLASIIVIVIGLFVKLMNASTKGLDQTVALDIAQNKLDQAAQSSPSKWLIYNSEAHSVTDPRTPTTFHYTLTPRELTSNSAADNKMGDMYHLDLEVYWWPEKDKEVSTRRDMGRLSVKLSRVVYIENMKQ